MRGSQATQGPLAGSVKLDLLSQVSGTLRKRVLPQNILWLLSKKEIPEYQGRKRPLRTRLQQRGPERMVLETDLQN